MTDELHTIKAAARRLHTTADEVRDLINLRKIKTVLCGRLIPLSEIERVRKNETA